jgi:hypothetical protein
LHLYKLTKASASPKQFYRKTKLVKDTYKILVRKINNKQALELTSSYSN